MCGLTACTATSDTVVVEIRDRHFVPAAVEVTPGTTVTWINRDATPHLIRPQEASGTTWAGGELTSGARISHTFDEPARWQYHCRYHPDHEMVGVVIVDTSPPPEG